MNTKTIALLLLLPLRLAGADVGLYSAFPTDLNLQIGGSVPQQVSLGPMQEVRLACSEAELPASLLDDQGHSLWEGKLANDQYWVLSPSPGKRAALTRAGSTLELGAKANPAIAFFNANSHAISLELYGKGEDEPLRLTVGAYQSCPPVALEAGRFKVYLKDDGGNPIGESYSQVETGNFYLLYRRRPTLYDVTRLGSLAQPR